MPLGVVSSSDGEAPRQVTAIWTILLVEDEYELAEAMDGSVAVESKVGQGSRFTVRLPIYHTGITPP
jgi:hypothetical protein